MSLLITHELTPEVGGKQYKVVYTEPSKAMQKELDAITQSNQEKMTSVLVAQGALQSADRAYMNNNALLELEDDVLIKQGVTRTELLFENRGYLKEIASQRVNMKVAAEDAPTADNALEAYYEKRFELLISGADQATLKKLVTSNKLTYTEMFNDQLEPLVKESKEKK